MLSFRKPSETVIRDFLAEQRQRELTYTEVGRTLEIPPGGYRVDHTRTKLGEGRQTFETAVAALRRWDQFRLGWLEAGPASTPIEDGQVVAIMARAIGFWWLNSCRIVAVIDVDGDVSQFGFAYGTLPAHVGTGEERFLIEWDHSDDAVWYDILAFSRPRHVLAKIGYPWFRMTQKRFGRDSTKAMRDAIDRATTTNRPAEPL